MKAIESYLTTCIRRGLFPGAVYLVAKRERVLASGALGWAALTPKRRKMRESDLFDIASLTKPLATAALVLRKIAKRDIRPHDEIRRFLPEAGRLWWGRRTVEHLLTHSSGLPAWYPLYIKGKGRESYLRTLSTLAPAYDYGTKVLYSCLGYIVLGFILESMEGVSVKRLFQSDIARPLGLKKTRFCPPVSWKKNIVPSERGQESERRLVKERELSFSGWRNSLIWGSVHDGNAWGLGGSAGNAGLFSTAKDLHTMAACMLGGGAKELCPPECKHLLFHNFTPRLNEGRSYGWQIGLTRGASAGRSLSPHAIGHTGFTGTSLWLDPADDKIYILLTNRLHPRASQGNMNECRRTFHQRAKRL